MPRRSAFAVALAVIAAACSGTTVHFTATTRAATTAPGAHAPAARALVWRHCGAALECAVLRVPLDPARATGREIRLALFRHRAESADRIGSLLVNPGGPGAPGRPLAALASRLFPKSLRDRFDIVAWDPRGTGASTAVQCGERLDAFYAVDRSDDSVATRRANERTARALAARCRAGSGALLAHLATRDTVADMDAIRAALGDAGLTYLGLSYGTYLGARYATTYPTRVRALVLDGAVDPAAGFAEGTEQQSDAFEAALDRFLTACSSDRTCAFRSGGDATGALHRLLAQIEAEPLTVDVAHETRTLGPTEARIGIASALYEGEAAWPALAAALARAATGDGAPLLQLSDDYTERDAGGRYARTQEAFYAISCLDEPVTAADVERVVADAVVHAPVLGPVNGWLGLPCAYWPVRAVDTPRRLTRPATLPAVMVVSSTGDAVTPYESGVALARQLGARLVSVTGDAHTAFVGGGACVHDVVVHYLVTARAPARDVRCQSNR
jgi:pimeloyl-ACP methyl ester carboxylesterase